MCLLLSVLYCLAAQTGGSVRLPYDPRTLPYSGFGSVSTGSPLRKPARKMDSKHVHSRLRIDPKSKYLTHSPLRHMAYGSWACLKIHTLVPWPVASEVNHFVRRATPLGVEFPLSCNRGRNSFWILPRLLRVSACTFLIRCS